MAEVVEARPADPFDVLDPAPEAPPVRPRRRRWALVTGAALALAAGGGVLYWRGGAEPAVKFETAKVDRGRIAVQVTASGTVSALKTVLVGSQVSGRVAELHADFNDTVKKGQLLARLDTQLFKAAVAQSRASRALAQANVTKAEAQLADANRQLARQKALGAAQVLSEEAVETSQAAAEVARAALAGVRAQAQQAAASLEQAELNLAMTAIYSPIDGVVISRSVDVGQTVAASLQAPTVFTLAEDLRKMQMEAHVAENDVAKLGPGMPVSFTVDAFAGRKFSGTLRQVRNAALTVQNVVTYDAIVDVANPDLELRPGMTANVTFVVADKPDVLRIPNAALRFRPTPELSARVLGTGPAQPRGRTGARAPGSDRTSSATLDRPVPAADRPAAAADRPAPASDRKLVYVLEGPESKVRAARVRVGVTDGSFTELIEGDLADGSALVTDMNDGTPAARKPPSAAASPIGGGAPVGPGMGSGRGRRS